MFDALLYAVASFYKGQCEHIQRDVMGSKYGFCFKFPGVRHCRELAKSNDI